MVNVLKKKLKSNRGASMMLALALFLVCTMVSSVIISAAVSNSSRNLERTDKQRAYLAVSSASSLVTEELKDMGQYVGSYEIKVFGCTDYQKEASRRFFDEIVTGYEIPEGLIPGSMDPIIVDESHPNEKSVITDIEKTTVDGLFGDLIIKAAEQVYLKGEVYSESFQISLAESDERLPDVDCKFTMDSKYNITVEITTTDSDYAIIVNVECVDAQTATTNISPFGCDHTVYYKAIQQDGSYIDAQKVLNIPGKSEITYTTVTWGVPEVTKGVDTK